MSTPSRELVKRLNFGFMYGRGPRGPRMYNLSKTATALRLRVDWILTVDQEKQSVEAALWQYEDLIADQLQAQFGRTATNRKTIGGDARLAILAADEVDAQATVVTLAQDYLIAIGVTL